MQRRLHGFWLCEIHQNFSPACQTVVLRLREFSSKTDMRSQDTCEYFHPFARAVYLSPRRRAFYSPISIRCYIFPRRSFRFRRDGGACTGVKSASGDRVKNWTLTGRRRLYSISMSDADRLFPLVTALPGSATPIRFRSSLSVPLRARCLRYSAAVRTSY